MSSILDALKKSEHQRSLGRDLIFRTARHDAPPRLTWFAIAVPVTLILLVAVIGVLLFNLRQPDIAVTVTTPAVTADSGRFGLLPSRGITPSMEGRTAEREAVPTGTNAGEAPWLSGLPEDFRGSLPPLNVNIHVYSPDESQRILYINNRQVRRGERIQAGVLVEEIAQDGVVLRFRGQRFKLPRPS